MKPMFFFAAAFTLSLTAQAGELCQDVTLSWNSHPVSECPAVTGFCLDEASNEMTLVSAEGLTARFNGRQTEGDSDVGQTLMNSYTLSNGMYSALELNDDGRWPARQIPGVRALEIYTGFRSTTGVHRSQICLYRAN